jgi:ubiquinone/menaquinone biosynthesis C-methylase UbiE
MKTGGMTGLDWGDGSYETTAVELRPATAAALAAADLKPGEHVLDVGTGTGNAAVAALRRGGVRVLGIDPAPRLLSVARARAADLGLPAEFRLASATALPVPDNSQDLVLSVFAVIFEPDGPAAVAELVRVTRPGGRIVLTTWTDQGAVFRCGRRLREALAAVSPAPAGPPPTNWLDDAVIQELFAAHPVTVCATRHQLAFRAASPEDWFARQEREHPAWRAGRRVLDDATWARLREESVAELTAANEDPTALSVTSTYRVLRIDVDRPGP